MSISCPTCGRDDFDAEVDMKIHHTHAHGESIAGVEAECTYCGEAFRGKRNRLENRERPFCTPECQHQWRREHYHGENNPAWKGGPVETSCATCGAKMEVIRAKHRSYEKHFCSPSCHGEWTSQNQCGEAHPNYVGKITVECESCGQEMERYPSQVYESGRVFCSQECRGEWLAKNWSGEDNPNFLPDTPQRPYCAPFQRNRKKALQRDDRECQRCGMDETQHYEQFGRSLHVHHTTPVRTFDDQSDAHTLDNLRTLCAACHRKVEAKLLRSE